MDPNNKIIISDNVSCYIYKRHNLFGKNKPKFNSKNKKVRRSSRYKIFKISILILFFILILSTIKFLKLAYPTFKSSCENEALSTGNKILSEVISLVMKEYSYDDLVKIDKDSNGNINYVYTNSVLMNEIVNKIIYEVQVRFDNIPRIDVDINLGTVSGISFLSRFDPKFTAKLESSGKIYSNIRTEFNNVGINQTEHKIYIDLDGIVSILTPINTFSKEMSEEVLLVESIIVGKVPETYYNLTSNEKNIEDLFE